MESQPPIVQYDPNQYFSYPFTLFSNPKKTFISKSLDQPYCYEVYCPISCKKIKIGACRQKQKQAIQFNTTSSRWVSTVMDKTLKYLVNRHPPNKKDKKKIEGKGWQVFIEVNEKGNYAIFNPYCIMPNDPLSFYIYQELPKIQNQEKLEIKFGPTLDQLEIQQINIKGKKIYLSKNQFGTCIGMNKFFNDDPNGQITLTNPSNQNEVIYDSVENLVKIVNQHKNYWLKKLKEIIEVESKGQIKQEIIFNLDEIYTQLNYYLNLQQQIIAKLSNSLGLQKYNNFYPYHPRLYSAFSRLKSLINYGETKYNIKVLAELGFYNKSDMLQDLSYFQYPDLPIPNSEDTCYKSQFDIRKRLFSFSRLQKQLPFPNISLQTTLRSILYQSVSQKKVLKIQKAEDYLLFLDQNYKLSIWSTRLFPIKLLEIDFNQINVKASSALIISESQIKDSQPVIDQKDDSNISSLFEQLPQKEVKPVEIQPDQTMVEHMLSMGYGISMIKKALVSVKNESIPAAIDAIQQIMSEQKKKVKEKRKEWSCSVCTFFNKANTDTCEMCGQMLDLALEEQKEKQRAEIQAEKKKQAEREEERLRVEKQKENQKLKKEIQDQKRLKEIAQKQELIKKSSLLSIKLLYNEESPLDPFFVVSTFWNNDLKKSFLKILRFGINRNHLTKFYRIQNGSLRSNINRKLYPISFDSYTSIAYDSRDLIEWGIKLIENSKIDEWQLRDSKQIEFAEEYNIIQTHDQHSFTLIGPNKKLTYKIVTKDDLKQFSFQILQVQKIQQGDQNEALVEKSEKIRNIYQANETILLDQQVSQINIEVIEHLPIGEWKNTPKTDVKYSLQNQSDSEIIRNQFIPLAIEHYEGSVFSGKHYATTMLQKSSNLYISNYPNTNFTFKHNGSQNLLVQKVVIISSSKRLQKIFSIYQGLIFTANQISWFHLAKEKFSKFSKEDYLNWLTYKKSKTQHRDYWEPVAFFQFENQVEVEIEFKRSAKYIFLLPTNIKNSADKKDEVYAIKIDFFGAKGRIEQEKVQESIVNYYKKDGKSNCEIFVKEYHQNEYKTVDLSNIFVKSISHVNSYHFLPKDDSVFQKMPLSVTTLYSVKFKNRNIKKSIEVNSKFVKRISLTINKEPIDEHIDYKQITSFRDLISLQNSLTIPQLKKIAQTLPLQELVILILAAQNNCNQLQSLIHKIDSHQIKQEMFNNILSIIPQLCDEKIKVTDSGFKYFMIIFEKNLNLNLHRAFEQTTQAIKNIILYVNKNRSKNYNLLRYKYNIQQLVLEPYLFSKDYYRLVHPSYIEEQTKTNIAGEITGKINNCMYIHQTDSYSYTSYIDLLETRNIDKIKLFVPKIASVNFRPKLIINIWVISNDQKKLIYHRYFHEDLLVQLGVYGFKDHEIFKGERLNCLTIPDIDFTGRFIKIDVSFLILTSHPNLKYKETAEKYFLIPLVDSRPSELSQNSQKTLNYLNSNFPNEAKHIFSAQKLPPCKYYNEDVKYIYQIHEFPVIELDIVKKQYSEMVQKIMTNIMDEGIVRETVKNMKISYYQLNRKGIDFAYTYIIFLMNLSKKFNQEQLMPVDLLLQLFDTMVVYESGPIMKKTFSFLQENYKKLTNLQKAVFIESIILKYLSNIQNINEFKIAEKYSPLKILQKLKQFELPVGNLMIRLKNSSSRCLRLILLKIIIQNLKVYPECVNHRQLYSIETGRYTKELTFYEMINLSFKNCLWILDNVQGIKEQSISEGLDLLLIFIGTENTSISPEIRSSAIKQFMEKFSQQQIWKLLFLIQKLKSKPLKEKLYKLFKILIENITQKFLANTNSMLHQIITKQSKSIYVQINGEVSDDVWMNHLQTTLQLFSMTKNKVILNVDIALQLLQLPLTPSLWNLALQIIPKDDKILLSIIKNFKREYYSSLGKQITDFCVPIAGIRPVSSLYINWLDLIRKIRLQGRTIFELFIQQLELTSFGGKEGLYMATVEEVKQIQITNQYATLVLQSKQQFILNQNSQLFIKKLISWYFLNKTNEKGASPATQKIYLLSQNIKTIFIKISQFEHLLHLILKILLQIRKESQIVERNFEQKRISIHSALTLNKRFCECFEELLGVFMTTDELCSYFAFDIKGLQYILRIMNIDKDEKIKSQVNTNSIACLPDEQILISENLIQTKINKEPTAVVSEIKEVDDLKEEQFATNIKLLPNLNVPNLVASNVDWTVYKRGNKSKILCLSMTEANYYQHPVYIQLAKTIEVRSIKIGFPAASYEFTDKLVVTPSSILVEGSADQTNFEPIGQMEYIADEAYVYNGVQVFALNCQKIRGLNSIQQSLKTVSLHKIKCLKIVIKRPLITFLEGQYSQFNGKPYNNLCCSISFLSVTGDDSQKLPFTLVESCRQISKKSSLNILVALLNESNIQTTRKISNDEIVAQKIQRNFKKIKEYMSKYPEVMPNFVYLIGAGNKKLGNWILQYFLKDGSGQIEAKIINQIITSTPQKIFERMSLFQRNLLKKISQINNETEIQSGLLYNKQIFFMQSFCKTLEECYEIGFKKGDVLECTENDIRNMINIYDKKHSSPEIKSIVKLLIYLLYIQEPLSLSENLAISSMNIIWSNCSEAKSHFYNLMGALLIHRKAAPWIKQNNYHKVSSLIQSIDKSITLNNLKILKLQIFLLCQISYHEQEYLRQNKTHINLYNKLKNLTFTDGDVIQSLLKILKNIILKDSTEQKIFSQILYNDVALLVKRRDPYLQKLFVGILGLENEIMINFNGLDIKNKKQPSLNSKYLSKKNQNWLLQKINKKHKFSLVGDLYANIRLEHQQLFIKTFSSNLALLILRFKVQDKPFTIGVFSTGKSKRSEQSGYLWQQVVLYEKGSFIFLMNEQEQVIIQNTAQNMLANMYGGEEQQDNAAVFYDSGNGIINFVFSLNNQSTVPKINIGKYASQLGNSVKEILEQDSQGYNFIGLQLWSLKSGQVSLSDRKLSNLLNKSNQAKTPFNFYRHSPIYIFPANITIKKLLTILGIKAVCAHKGSVLAEKTVLGDLQKLCSDFIIDLSITNHDESKDEETEVNQIGYIPIMNIFNNFSTLNGVNEVLRLGSESIKQWKKADRKKNFEHYMEELKSFICLPNFFNLFIKNQQYVNLIFEVASGMPDDDNSTKNWEQQYVSNFRFIYKIVSDIFKFDRSVQLRDMNKYSDFCQVILDKLCQISKEGARQIKIEDQKNQKGKIELPEIQKKKSQQNKKRKKKGIGYGADNQNNSKWSASEWLENRKNVSQEILRVITILVSFFDCEVPLTDDRLSLIVYESCLLPLLESSLRSGSLLDISKESELFKSYLQIIRLLAGHPATIECLLDIDKKYKPQQSESIYNLLTKLNGIAAIFTDCLKSGKQQLNSTNQVAQTVSLDIQKTFSIVDKAVKSIQRKTKSLTIKEIDNLPVSEAYRKLLGGLRFGYVNLKEGSSFRHAHSSSISSSNPSTAKILRLSQQLADLSSSLPVEHTNSIFVRCDSSRIDVINVLIMGSKDTPYSNGAFTFDVYCDDSYPNNPPKMLITTTGQGKIRFNPNLYSCGKVCLSLLGTWRGSASENWDPKLSTLLQLFISTQGITMSDDVYFNEPGFEGEQGTEEGQRKNQAYSNIVRLGNVRYAMNGQIKNPPKGFEEVIKRHFYIKKKEIIEECQKWVEYAQKREASYNGLVNDHNSSWCNELKSSKTKYKQLLVKEVEELKDLLSKIPPPDLQTKEEEKNFSNQKVAKVNTKSKDIKLEEIDVGYDTNNKEVKQYEQNAFNDRWSRYIGAMGIQAVRKQAESNVLLIGLKPLGLEIAKNLVLSGLKRLTIVEKDKIIGNSEHFYMANLKSNQIKDCIFKIKELNPYMLVEHSEQIPKLKEYSVVISTLNMEQSLIISDECRQAGIKFIYAQTQGVSGLFFADLGQKHEVNDLNGQEPFEGIIKHISNAEQGIITLLDGVKHPYQDGDFIVLRQVQGMEIIQEKIQEKSQEQLFYQNQSHQKASNINDRVFKIKVINWNSFSIGDTTNFKPYIGNGICKNVKIPQKIQFKSFSESVKNFEELVDSNLGIYDFEKMSDNLSIFESFKAVSEFKNKHKRLPFNWNIEDSNEIGSIVDKNIEIYKKESQQHKKIVQFGKIFSFIAEAELPTIGAYFGGIVSQEVLKAITSKYMPIKQFFAFHLNQMIQKLPEQESQRAKLQVKEEQPFRNLKIVIGSNINKIQKLNTFVIGAGAIGCELLKNFAMINMGAQGQIVVTDPDHIQTSNLSRQFLFRQKHIKKAKSATACATLLQLNPKLEGHIIAKLDKVCEETEDTYSNQFFKSRALIANALDNVRARQYVDKRCVENKIPLFESGTLGAKGHVQVIVPYKTQNYGSQNDPNEEAQIPHCTLKMFPQQTIHCIEWARDIFGKIFTLDPKALKKVIEAKNLNILEGQQKQTVAKMIKHRPQNFDDCIAEAVRKFFVYFRNNVRQLLFTYPVDMKTKEGKPFWQLPKRPPKQINELDEKNQTHRTFISSYSALLAKIYSIPYPQNFRKVEGKDKIMEIAKKVKVEQFIPNEQNSKEIEKQVQKQAQKQIPNEIEESIVQNIQVIQKQNSEQLELTEDLLELKITPEQFQKDQDSNGHIDLIFSMSNLRSANYSLNQCTWIQAKLKAGKIMAALSTTTSVVAALQTIQIIKLAMGSSNWRNAFINLAVPLIQISEPGPAVKHQIGNTTFSVWEDIQLQCQTLGDILTQLKQKYEVQGFNISTEGGKPVYWEAMYKDKQESKQAFLNKPLKELFSQQSIYLNILMRKVGSQQSYNNIPRVKVTVI